MSEAKRAYEAGEWCGECRFGVVEDPPCCTVPTCTVCAIKAAGGDRFPDPLPDEVWMCAGHWNVYLAMALGPMDQHLPTRVSLIPEPHDSGSDG